MPLSARYCFHRTLLTIAFLDSWLCRHIFWYTTARFVCDMHCCRQRDHRVFPACTAFIPFRDLRPALLGPPAVRYPVRHLRLHNLACEALWLLPAVQPLSSSQHLVSFLCLFYLQTSRSKYSLTRMWADAQRDGRPAEYQWRPLFNAAKFGWRPLLDAVQ